MKAAWTTATVLITCVLALAANIDRATGDSSLLRGTWIPQRGSVRETAQRSKNGGATWEPVFDIVFRPHGGRKGT